MNNKGFSLVELLAVIVLIGVIGTLAYTSINYINGRTKVQMYNTKISFIETAAVNYGEDFKGTLKSSTDFYDNNPCLSVKVSDLVPNYLDKDTDNECLSDYNTEGCIINPKDNTYLDNYYVVIYFKNNRVKAIVADDDTISCGTSGISGNSGENGGGNTNSYSINYVLTHPSNSSSSYNFSDTSSSITYNVKSMSVNDASTYLSSQISGYSFKEWNSNQDGAGLSFKSGQSYRVFSNEQIRNIDTNGNGKIDKEDFDALTNYLVGKVNSLPNSVSGDVNLDGNVNNRDLTAILNGINSNETLYSIWTKQISYVTYVINYSANGGNIGTPIMQTVNGEIGNVKFTVMGNDSYYRNGYRFVGWNTKSNGTGTDYNVGTEMPISDNLTLYAKWEVATNLAYGDVNLDGRTNINDLVRLSQYLEDPITNNLSNDAKKNADVNDDGIIDRKDLIILQEYIKDKGVTITLPYKDAMYGDSNMSGTINVNDLVYMSNLISSGNITPKEFINSDVNLDGVVDKKDLVILAKYIKDKGQTFSLPYTNALYGDVNLDGRVTIEDAEYTLFYYEFPSDYPLTNIESINADVNLDGEVDDDDAIIIKFHVDGVAGYEILPIEGKHFNTLIGDVSLDGSVTELDYGVAFECLYNRNRTPFNCSEQALINADVNQDLTFDDIDQQILVHYIRSNKAFNLPYKNLKLGDVDLDGKVTYADRIYIFECVFNEGSSSLPCDIKAKMNADVNWDLELNEYDWIILTRYFDDNSITFPYKNLKLGDVNLDGEVNETDATYLNNYLGNLSGYTMNARQKLNADVNLDLAIDAKDLTILRKHLSGVSGYENLPYKN